MDTQGWIAIEAEHYSRCKDGFDREGQPMQWKCLAGYGKTLSAMKAFPTDSYADAENGAPYIEYSIVTKQAGDYEAEFYMQPSNPAASSAVNTILPQAAPGEAPRPLPIGVAALSAFASNCG